MTAPTDRPLARQWDVWTSFLRDAEDAFKNVVALWQLWQSDARYKAEEKKALIKQNAALRGKVKCLEKCLWRSERAYHIVTNDLDPDEYDHWHITVEDIERSKSEQVARLEWLVETALDEIVTAWAEGTTVWPNERKARREYHREVFAARFEKEHDG